MNRLRRILSDSRWAALACLTCFIAGVIFGAASYSLVKEQMKEIVKAAFGGIIVEGSDFQTIVNIFLRNIWASVILMVLGTFIIPTLFILFLNGFIIGVVVRLALDKGVSVLKLFLGVVPHGIFEVPAIILAASLGLRIGLSVIFPGGKSRLKAFAKSVREASATYLLVVLPLLFLAAIIEVLISKRIVT